MPRQALDQPARRLVDREALRAERHALVERHAIADDRGLADHDAGAVVDEELAADPRAGVDVDAGAAVRVLGEQARQQRHVELVEDVRDAMARDREHAGIGVERLDRVAAGRIAAPGRACIVEHAFAKRRQALEQLADDVLGRAAAASASIAPSSPRRAGISNARRSCGVNAASISASSRAMRAAGASSGRVSARDSAMSSRCSRSIAPRTTARSGQ